MKVYASRRYRKIKTFTLSDEDIKNGFVLRIKHYSTVYRVGDIRRAKNSYSCFRGFRIEITKIVESSDNRIIIHFKKIDQ